MENISCNVIKDLLPSYIDGVLSKDSKELVDEHLKHCNKCNEELKVLSNKYKNFEFNQNDQIEFLKGYKLERMKRILASVLLTIVIVSILFVLIIYTLQKWTFEIDLDSLYVMNTQQDVQNDITEITFFFSDEKYDIEVYEYTNDSAPDEIYLKVVGKFPFYDKANRTYHTFTLKDGINKIYIENTNGDLREIWPVQN